MTEPSLSLTDLSEAQRAQAYSRFRIIRPALEDGVPQAPGGTCPQRPCQRGSAFGPALS